MTIADLMARRFACKRFDGCAITEEQLHLLEQTIRLAPSSLNSQPWIVTIVESPEVKRRLVPFSKHNGQKVTTCSHLFVFSVVKDMETRFEQAMAIMEQDPVLAGNLERYRKMVPPFLEQKRGQDLFCWQARQAFLPLMALMLHATELGLDSCPMEGFEREGYAEVLGLHDAIPLVLCAIGNRDMEVSPKVRLPVEAIFRRV